VDSAASDHASRRASLIKMNGTQLTAGLDMARFCPIWTTSKFALLCWRSACDPRQATRASGLTKHEVWDTCRVKVGTEVVIEDNPIFSDNLCVHMVGETSCIWTNKAIVERAALMLKVGGKGICRPSAGD
jgi:hypothetical protein